MKTPIRHVAWRDGRPRFSPGPELRAAGYKGKDLKTPDGLWLSRGQALDWSDAFIKELAEQAATAARASRVPAGGRREAPHAVRPKQGKPLIYTVGQLFQDWWRSTKFLEPADSHEARRLRAAHVIYAPKTVRDFKQKAGVIERYDADLWASPVDSLSQPVLFGLYEELVRRHGLATARGAIAVFSIALAWGRKRGKFTFRMNEGQNPAKGLGMATPPARIRFGSRTEILTLVAAADHLGWRDMGDMVVLGVWTGQRQADRLQLVDKGLLNRRRIFRQAKTGAIVAVLEAPELEARLKSAAERRRQQSVVNPRVVLDEIGPHWASLCPALKLLGNASSLAGSPSCGERPPTAAGRAADRRPSDVSDAPPERQARSADAAREAYQWAPFPDDGDRYRKRFAALRAIAAAGIRDEAATEALQARWRAEGRNSPPPVVWLVKPCPSLLGDPETGLQPFFEADLRDTAVTWMGLAGVTIPEIVAITGHALESATRILRHYLARHPEMADSAIRKLVEWYEADGETEIGL